MNPLIHNLLIKIALNELENTKGALISDETVFEKVLELSTKPIFTVFGMLGTFEESVAIDQEYQRNPFGSDLYASEEKLNEFITSNSNSIG